MKKLLLDIWTTWKKIAHTIGVFQTKLFLTVFYYALLLPFGLAVRLFADPLALRARPKSSGWVERATRDKTLADLRRQA